MKFLKLLPLTAASAAVGAASAQVNSGGIKTSAPPHLFMLLVDDLGYNNVPWTNPEQKAETLKSLATEEGVLLTRLYGYMYCSPSRAALMSGRFPIHVYEQSNTFVNGVAGGVDLRMTMLPAKLKQKHNYSTSAFGKWHVGSFFEANLPINRGYDYHLGFLGGAEDHFHQTDRYNGETYVDLWENNGPAHGKNGTNSCYLYGRKAVELVRSHNTTDPMFMYLAFQNCHEPYQALPEYEDPNVPEVRRSMYGMLSCVGDVTHNMTVALKEKNMWDNTLILWSSDNGGPQYWQANNYPLRGGKITYFEGGMRLAAFATGGLLHPSLKGQSLNNALHLADIYTTFCVLSGQTEEECRDPIDVAAHEAPVPNTDGIDFSRLLVEAEGVNATRPTPIILSSTAWIDGDYKYIQWDAPVEPWCEVDGKKSACGYWTTPEWPTSEAHHVPAGDEDHACPADGCVFNVVEDKEERHDLSGTDPKRQQAMKAQLAEFVKGAYHNEYSGGYTDCENPLQFIENHGDFIGPCCKYASNKSVISFQ